MSFVTDTGNRKKGGEKWNDSLRKSDRCSTTSWLRGAAELGQALNSQADAYVPYGAGQAPLEVEGPATSYQDMLREASQRATPDHGHEIER
jgi:hypothetical protein